ncbi:mitochondrial acyl carrier protein 1 [Wolffia australiana]
MAALAAAGWRSAVLRRLRVPPRAPWMAATWSSPIRFFSSPDDHIDKQEVVDRVLSVVRSYPGVDSSKVTPECHFQQDLGLDSLDTVEIVLALEEEFKLEIPDKEADKIDSCGVAIEYISSHPMAG